MVSSKDATIASFYSHIVLVLKHSTVHTVLPLKLIGYATTIILPSFDWGLVVSRVSVVSVRNFRRAQYVLSHLTFHTVLKLIGFTTSIISPSFDWRSGENSHYKESWEEYSLLSHCFSFESHLTVHTVLKLIGFTTSIISPSFDWRSGENSHYKESWEENSLLSHCWVKS